MEDTGANGDAEIDDSGIPIPTHLQTRNSSASAGKHSMPEGKQPEPDRKLSEEGGVWAALQGLEDDPEAAWDILSQTQVVRKVKTLPLDTPMKTGFTRFVCFSDTHTLHEAVQIPMGDVLIHAGDFTNMGLPGDVVKFNDFLGTLPHPAKIVVAGNHDLTFDAASYPRLWQRFMHPEQYDCAEVIKSLTNCTLLTDSEVTIRGHRIWGSPWQPEFCDWAFNLPRGEKIRQKWDLIPEGIDVLVTHGPPLGHGDLCRNDRGRSTRAGCVDLLRVAQRIRPAYHIFGHIHEGYGMTEDGMGIKYINASSCTHKYKPTNPCIIFDLPNHSD